MVEAVFKKSLYIFNSGEIKMDEIKNNITLTISIHNAIPVLSILRNK